MLVCTYIYEKCCVRNRFTNYSNFLSIFQEKKIDECGMSDDEHFNLVLNERQKFNVNMSRLNYAQSSFINSQ